MSKCSWDGEGLLDEQSGRFLGLIKATMKEAVEDEYARLLDIDEQSVRKGWTLARHNSERCKAEASVKYVADRLPGLHALGWSVRALQRWLNMRKLPSPRWLLDSARLEHAKHLMLCKHLSIDDTAYRINREREALDALFKTREGMTAAQWLGVRSQKRKSG